MTNEQKEAQLIKKREYQAKYYHKMKQDPQYMEKRRLQSKLRREAQKLEQTKKERAR